MSGNPAQYDVLSVFIEEQELMRELVAVSTLPTLELDVSDSDVAAAADKVADWFEATGGLYAPE